LTAGAANKGAKTRQQFFDAKGFRDVIIGSAVDTLDFLVLTTSSGKHEYGNGNAGVAPVPENRQAVDLRQAEIEHHRVVLFRLSKKVGAFAIKCAINSIASVAKRAGQLAGQPRFVLSQQDLHIARYSANDAERMLNTSRCNRCNGCKRCKGALRINPAMHLCCHTSTGRSERSGRKTGSPISLISL